MDKKQLLAALIVGLGLYSSTDALAYVNTLDNNSVMQMTDILSAPQIPGPIVYTAMAGTKD